MSEAKNLNNLPTELILEIFSYLDYKDLTYCGCVSRRLNHLANHETFWGKFCKKYWLETSCPPDKTWKECFLTWYQDMGKYINHYATLRTAWDKVMTFVMRQCPVITQNILDGTTEEQLDHFEYVTHLKLPLDFRCSYRIHNGQRLSSPGLMGSMSIHGYCKSESLLDIDTILAAFQSRVSLNGCIPITFCLHSGVAQYLAVSDCDGYDKNSVFSFAKDGSSRQDHSDAFITAKSFSEWFVEYANHLHNNDFIIVHGQPFKFLHDPLCEETTGPITVSVATCFLPEFSTLSPPTFYHSYRITMSMSPEAPQSETCQLETRHWIIKNNDGIEQEVDGAGVVGEFPLMYPGAHFSWVSSTTFNTTYGNMKGKFRMRNIITGEMTEVQCPVFHMYCLPYITACKRNIIRCQRKFRVNAGRKKCASGI